MDDAQKKRAAELREILAVDAGSPEFVELAKLLVEDAETRPECREVCFKGLSRDGKRSLGRLVLARSYYLDGLIEFSVRELVELSKYAEVPSLSRLLKAFGPHGDSFLQNSTSGQQSGEEASESEEEVLAEIDLDDEFVEGALDEIEGELEIELE